MKDQNVRLYRRVSFLVEIFFGLLLLINGLMLIANYAGLFSFPPGFLDFISFDSISSKTAQEWRFLIGFLHTMVAIHIAASVMICLGIIILVATIYTKKSL